MNHTEIPLSQIHKNPEHSISPQKTPPKKFTMQDIAALVQPSSPLIMDERKVIELSEKLASKGNNHEFSSK